MNPSTFRPKVFVSYAHEDRELKEKFDINLKVLRDQKKIDVWTDGEILPGDHWSREITQAMNSADLILFMVSNHFLASDFIRKTEAPMAMQRVNQGLAIIVPVILTETPGWKQEDWCTLQALPSGVRPVDDASWRKPERAFADVEEELRKLIALLPAKLAKKAAEWNHGAGSGGDGGEPPMLPRPASRPWKVLALGVVVLALVFAGRAAWQGRAPLSEGLAKHSAEPLPVIPPHKDNGIIYTVKTWERQGTQVTFWITVDSPNRDMMIQFGLNSVLLSSDGDSWQEVLMIQGGQEVYLGYAIVNLQQDVPTRLGFRFRGIPPETKMIKTLRINLSPSTSTVPILFHNLPLP